MTDTKPELNVKGVDGNAFMLLAQARRVAIKNHMKLYRDVFGNPLPKRDVELAARFVVHTGSASASAMQRNLRWGYGKCARIIELLADAKVVGPLTTKPRIVILASGDAATNAALRQLKRGKKA